jgi:hypothetical protein
VALDDDANFHVENYRLIWIRIRIIPPYTGRIKDVPEYFEAKRMFMRYSKAKKNFIAMIIS